MAAMVECIICSNTPSMASVEITRVQDYIYKTQLDRADIQAVDMFLPFYVTPEAAGSHASTGLSSTQGWPGPIIFMRAPPDPPRECWG